jgi:hypothetical protein
MTTINGTITTGAVAQWQAALNASTSIVIKNNAALEQLIVSATGPAGPLNGVIIDTSLTIDNAGNNPGLWPAFSNGAISIFGRNTGQSFSIVYS